MKVETSSENLSYCLAGNSDQTRSTVETGVRLIPTSDGWLEPNLVDAFVRGDFLIRDGLNPAKLYAAHGMPHVEALLDSRQGTKVPD